MQLQGKRIAILVADNFEQVELTEPKKALDKAGAQTYIVAPKPGTVSGMNHDQKADSFKVDKVLDQVTAGDFDALMLPGGALNADTLRVVPHAQQFVQEFAKSNKPIAFICHAPWLLVSAGLVKGRSLTSYHTIQDDIRNAGGNWQDSEVVRDGNFVSSRQPSDIPAFNRAMLELFAEATNAAATQAANPYGTTVAHPS